MASEQKKAFLKGFRSVLFNMGITILGALAALDPAALGLTGPLAGGAAVVVGLANIGLRAITTTPIGTDTPK